MVQNIHKWKFAVDRGGTFTDVIAIDPEGFFHTIKLLSTSPEYDNASIEGINRILKKNNINILSSENVKAIRFGTTVATNSLLERKGGNLALLITQGLPDLLEISNQTRPEIFNLKIVKPSLLYKQVFEINERINCSGKIIKKLNNENLKKVIKKLKKDSFDAVAVVLMHSWKNPAHEIAIKDALLNENINNVFLSHEAVNLIKIVSRGQSTVVDAYLSPVIAMYLEGIQKETSDISIEFIQSSGGLSKPSNFKGKDAILSGPAGGVIAVGNIADSCKLKGSIGFDMGGTSTDVCRYDGTFEKLYEQVIADIEIQKESLNIITIASGGGSVLWFDGQKMKVGPESAGASPGPACYGFGGVLTITDANLLTGRLAVDFFPRTFGPSRNASLDKEITIEKFKQITQTINQATNMNLTPVETALGFIKIANEKMAMAIKEISVSRGYDVRNYALICFGGAGGQHACEIASILGIKKIIFHPLSGVMSAYGIGLASPVVTKSKTVLKPLNIDSYEQLQLMFESLQKEILPPEITSPDDFTIHKELDIRPVGTESYLTTEYINFNALCDKFKHKYKSIYGFEIGDIPLEIVNLRVSIKEKCTFFQPFSSTKNLTNNKNEPVAFQKIYYENGPIKSPVYLREMLEDSFEITGPAFIIDKYSTLIVDKNYKAVIKTDGIIELIKESTIENNILSSNTEPDPILLEIFNNLFTSIASEMGLTLRNTSYSVNIKERLDFSCAIFDKNGDLVANAPHIPVHLGSMTETVKTILIEHYKDLKPGDVYITNDPYNGGSHLPDITLVCPVYSEENKIIFFTAARGHHSDIGGITPGSFPPVASHIDQEGVLIKNFLAVRNGVLRETELKNLLLNHKYPVRNLNERIFDIKAQIAACYKGVKGLNDLVSKYSLETVNLYMFFIQQNAEYCVKLALEKFLAGNTIFESDFEDFLDDGSNIKVNLQINAGNNPPKSITAKIDFSGTAKQHLNDNLNTPISVTKSAILYVLRALTNVDIPLNSGCIKPIEIIAPEGSLLNPVYPAPVASGNVETSQRIVDVVLGAFGITSASQGTMNNFLFEVEGDSPYYETISGGAGALDGYSGASAVQVHMTNTRITDPEVLEYRHPDVRLEQFKIRRGSGGCGLYPGGDGVIREVKFLKPAHITIISERRNYQPYGMSGGCPGKTGKNILKRSSGKIEPLKNRVELAINTDDSIIIKTPGAGGFGKTI
ncbi:MAG: hydantoinase B/oxoprolinase family protein [Cyanobacteriota bacterium]